jgi:hypothetical protein
MGAAFSQQQWSVLTFQEVFDQARFHREGQDGRAEARDFQTTGVVAFARVCPFYEMESGRMDVGGRRIQVNAPNLQNCREAIDAIVDNITLDATVRA